MVRPRPPASVSLVPPAELAGLLAAAGYSAELVVSRTDGRPMCTADARDVGQLLAALDGFKPDSGGDSADEPDDQGEGEASPEASALAAATLAKVQLAAGLGPEARRRKRRPGAAG